MLFCASCGSSEHVERDAFCPVCGAQPINTSHERRANDGEFYQPYGGGSGGDDDPGGYRANVPPIDPNAAWSPGANPYAAPGYGAGALLQQAGGGGLFGIGERREPLTVILLTLVTCGIYGYFWWFSVATDVRNALNREDINPAMEIVLSFITCGIYMIFLYYKYPQLILEMQDRVRLPRNDISTVSLLLGIFFPLAAMFIIQTELNKIWDAATGNYST